MQALAASLIEAGNPAWSDPLWQFSLGAFCELTRPIDFDLAERLVGGDSRVEFHRDDDVLRCEHCDYRIGGYVAGMKDAEFCRHVDRRVEEREASGPDECRHLAPVLDLLVAHGNYVTSRPTFRPVGRILQCELGDSLDAELVLGSLPNWCRVVVAGEDDEVYCGDCKASIVGPRFPWDRLVELKIDWSKMTRIEPPQTGARRRWWQRRAR